MMERVLSNVRGREAREGDILAQYAANAVAASRLRDVCDRFGAEVVLRCFDRFLDESDRLMRAEIAKVPAGEWRGEDWLDDDGVGEAPLRIAVAVRAAGDTLTFDFAGTAPEARGPLNATRFVTASAAFYAAHGGGEGGSAGRDGTNAIRVHMSNVMNTPVEVIESEYPLRVECCELRPDSAGMGRHRGGVGLRRAYRLLGERGELTTMIER